MSTPAADRTNQLLTAPPLPLLLKMASPNAAAFLVQTTVNMTEVWYVGQLGKVSLAAMALMFPLLMLTQMLANGAMGGGVTGAVARAMGAHNTDTAERLIWHALAIALVAGFGFLILVLVALEPLLSLMSNDPAVLAQARLYAVILFSGCPLIWSMALLNAVYSRFLPNKVVAGMSSEDDAIAEELGLLEGRVLMGGQPTAYVCQNYACQMPVTDPESLMEQLGAESDSLDIMSQSGYLLPPKWKLNPISEAGE